MQVPAPHNAVSLHLSLRFAQMFLVITAVQDQAHLANARDGHTGNTGRCHSDLRDHLTIVVARQHDDTDGAVARRGVVGRNRLVQRVPYEAVDPVVVAANARVA